MQNIWEQQIHDLTTGYMHMYDFVCKYALNNIVAINDLENQIYRSQFVCNAKGEAVSSIVNKHHCVLIFSTVGLHLIISYNL